MPKVVRQKTPDPAVTISRPQYNMFLRTIGRELGIPENEISAEIVMQYPKSTVPVIAELRSRGFLATEHSASTYAKKYVRMVGGVFMWTENDIDDFSQQLAKEGRFTRAAKLTARAGLQPQHVIRTAGALVEEGPR